MKAMNEATIIKLIQNGEADAYRTLVERYQAGVIIHCENIIKDRDIAEDIAQEAFIKAYEKIGGYDTSAGKFSTWLYAIAVNQTKDYIRKHRKTVSIENVNDITAEIPELTQAECREVRAAVAALQPPEYARVVQAYYWEGLRYEQIAAEMNVPRGTVATWLSRAKVSLRKELA